jgi:DNA-binding beta-propeller fold protein YncE
MTPPLCESPSPLGVMRVKRRERRAPFVCGTRWICAALLCLALATHAHAQLIISGNENKVDLISGGIRVIPATAPDSVSILDFSTFPPKVQTVDNVPNTVIGPPSNIAITPDGSLALIADSVKVNPTNVAAWIPNSEIHVLDLEAKPPRVIANVLAGKQPSGMSITHDGKFALVANRAEGTVTLLRISGKEVSAIETIKVCLPEESVSDVAISPDDKLALVTAQKGGFLAMLRLENGHIEFTGQKISAYGQPYRCLITPDGELGLTAGQGFGNGIDQDAITVVDLRAKPMRTIQHITIGAVPESIELSPDGKLLAATVMNGSSLAPTNSSHTMQGAVEILARRGKTFEKIKSIPVGAIPEGVAFTADGRYLVVQCHPARELWIFRVDGQSVKDTGLRIKVPGMPSSLRASPAKAR